MKYLANNSTGHAGEYFLAYKITKELGWPCRLLDIDIGIDAQVEVLTKEKISTGQFIALQIKTITNSEKGLFIRIRTDHLLYWKTLEIPVFIALVDLTDEKIYIKEINKRQTKKSEKNSSTKFEFNKDENIFSKDKFEEIFLLASSKVILENLKNYIDPVRNEIKNIEAHIKNFNNGSPVPEELINCMENWKNLTSKLDEAEAFARDNIKAKEEVSEIKFELNQSLGKLKPVMIKVQLDHPNSLYYKEFLNKDF